jgi:hypothetical protein
VLGLFNVSYHEAIVIYSTLSYNIPHLVRDLSSSNPKYPNSYSLYKLSSPVLNALVYFAIIGVSVTCRDLSGKKLSGFAILLQSVLIFNSRSKHLTLFDSQDVSYTKCMVRVRPRARDPTPHVLIFSALAGACNM